MAEEQEVRAPKLGEGHLAAMGRAGLKELSQAGRPAGLQHPAGRGAGLGGQSYAANRDGGDGCGQRLSGHDGLVG